MINTRLIDKSLEGILLLCVSVTVVTTLCVVFILGKESLSFFSQVSIFDFLFGTRWEPLLEPKSFGVLPLVCGTLLIAVGAMIIALPAGLIIATYLNEFASGELRSVVKPVLEILAHGQRIILALLLGLQCSFEPPTFFAINMRDTLHRRGNETLIYAKIQYYNKKCLTGLTVRPVGVINLTQGEYRVEAIRLRPIHEHIPRPDEAEPHSSVPPWTMLALHHRGCS